MRAILALILAVTAVSAQASTTTITGKPWQMRNVKLGNEAVDRASQATNNLEACIYWRVAKIHYQDAQHPKATELVHKIVKIEQRVCK